VLDSSALYTRVTSYILRKVTPSVTSYIFSETSNAYDIRV